MIEEEGFLNKEWQKLLERIKPKLMDDVKNIPERIDIWRLTHHYIFTCNNFKIHMYDQHPYSKFHRAQLLDFLEVLF